MRFVKYTTRWSHGHEDWEIKKILDAKDCKEWGYKNTKEYLEDGFFRDIHKEWNYSEHYRGIKYKIVSLKRLNKKDKEKLIKRYEEKIEHLKESIPYYENLLEELQK